jgi:hypothetical protein
MLPSTAASARGSTTAGATYWFGAESEYARSSVTEVLSFVGGTVIGVFGLIATVASGGSALVIATGLGLGVGGLALGAFGVASHEFDSSPQKWTNIHSAHDRKFIAEGSMVGKVDNGVFQTTGSELRLRELTDEEFKRYIGSEYIEHPADPSHARRIAGARLTHAQLEASLQFDGVLDGTGSIFPWREGDACWEIEDDSHDDRKPMQLWSRPHKQQVVWQIRPEAVAKGAGGGELGAGSYFSIYNAKLDRYATLHEGRIVARPRQTTKDGRASQLFQIIELPRSAGSSRADYAFIPSASPDRVIVPESGELGNSTKLVTSSITGPHPALARWIVSDRPGQRPART